MMRSMKSRDRTLAAFGRNVAPIRSQRGLSQDELAEKADLDRTYVSGIERVRVAVRVAGDWTTARLFKSGPVQHKGGKARCCDCDFIGFCGMKEAVTCKRSSLRSW